MRKIKYENRQSLIEYQDDCARICEVLATQGISISMHEAQKIWSNYSDKYAARWLILYETDEEIINALTYDDGDF